MEEPRRRHMLDDLGRNTQPATAWRELPRRHHKNAGGVAIYILPLAATGGRAELARHLSRTVKRHAYPCRKRLVWFALWYHRFGDTCQASRRRFIETPPQRSS